MWRTAERAVENRLLRLTALIALAVVAAALFFIPSTNTHMALNNHLSGLLTLDIFSLAAIVTLLIEARQWRETHANLLGKLRAWVALQRQGVMPIPSLPHHRDEHLVTTSDSCRRQAEIDDFIRQMIEIPWGREPQLHGTAALAAFQQASTATSAVEGDWAALRAPIKTFASLPAPWCYIGAARVMGRLSLGARHTSSPLGLRQGLRFIAEAQAVAPNNVEALLTRAELLAQSDDPRWLQLAEESLARARLLAPNHSELPVIEAVYLNHLRGISREPAERNEQARQQPALVTHRRSHSYQPWRRDRRHR